MLKLDGLNVHIKLIRDRMSILLQGHSQTSRVRDTGAKLRKLSAHAVESCIAFERCLHAIMNYICNSVMS